MVVLNISIVRDGFRLGFQYTISNSSYKVHAVLIFTPPQIVKNQNPTTHWLILKFRVAIQTQLYIFQYCFHNCNLNFLTIEILKRVYLYKII